MTIDRDRKIVNDFLSGMTLREVSLKHGVSYQTVSNEVKLSGYTSKDGGVNVSAALNKKCATPNCSSAGRGVYNDKVYCVKHLARLKRNGSIYKAVELRHGNKDGVCNVAKCDNKMIRFGLCNKHGTNYYLQKNNYNNVTDMDDYLKVQYAKTLMDNERPRISKIRKFMKDNPHHFKGKFYKGNDDY